MYVYMYVHTYYYIHSIHTYINMYTVIRILSVSSSVQVIMITAEDATNTTYSIIVTCTIHLDSDADMCEVIATANGLTLTGEQIT